MIYEPCLILRPYMVDIDASARVDSFTKIEGGDGVRIGRNVHIASFCHLNIGGGQLVIGSHSTCSSSVKICTGLPDLSYKLVSAAELETHVSRSKVTIGEYVVIFAGAIILPGVVIGNGSVIAAGSVVTKDVPPGEIWAGNPAKFLKTRVIEHEYNHSELLQKLV